MRLPGSSTLFPLLVLAMLAALTFWLDHASRGSGTGVNVKLRHDPDFWIDQLTMRRFDPQGAVQHTLDATRLVHYPDDDTTLVSNPRVTLFRGDTQATMTANSALLDKPGDRVRLQDAVRVVKTDPGGSSIVIDTSILDVFPDEETARTDVPVTITQGRSVIHGEGGLEINNKTRIAIINGPVRGTIYGKQEQ